MSTKTNRTRTAKPARKTTSSAKTPKKPAAKSRTGKAAAAAPPAPTGSKQAQLIALLRSPTGGTIEQMTELTGWQPHTVRGTISGVLRKRLGLNVAGEIAAEGGARVYRILAAAA